MEIDRTLELANVWFHFGTDGEAVVSLRRPGDAKPRGVRGHWELRGRELVLETDGGTIAAPWSVAEGVLRWGTEVLVRIP